MDEVMRQYSSHSTIQRELTCSVHFTNPHFNVDNSSASEGELFSVTRLVSKPEDLDLERIFKRATKLDELVLATNHSLFDLNHDFEVVRNWLKFEQPSKTKLGNVLRYTIERHLKTTVQVEINKMFFNCHLAVLQVYAKFFMELDEIPLVVTLPEDKVSQKAFMLIYKWMLSDQPILERSSIVSVYVAATYLRIEALLQHCWHYFDNAVCFNEDTACVLYVETQYNPAMDIVRNLMLTRIQKFLLTFASTRDFLSLPLKHLMYLLNSSSICVNTEIEVLFLSVRWLTFDWVKRQEHIRHVLTCVRFQLMPLWYLLYVRREETYEPLLEIFNIPEVDSIMNEAIANITSAIYKENLNEGNFDMTASLFDTNNQRRWIHDKACQYHHVYSCPNTRETRYSHFETYLKDLQKQPHDHWKRLEFVDFKEKRMCCPLMHV